jgi:hypothetical protein
MSMDLFSIRVIERKNRDRVIQILDELDVKWDHKVVGYGFTVPGFVQGDPRKSVDWIEKQIQEETEWTKHPLAALTKKAAGRGALPNRKTFQYMTMSRESANVISRALTHQGLKHRVSAAMVEITPRKSLENLDDRLRRFAVASLDHTKEEASELSFLSTLALPTSGIDFRQEYPPPPYGGWDMIPQMAAPTQKQANSQNTKRALAALLGFGRGPVA